jgi:hypothetical protein
VRPEESIQLITGQGYWTPLLWMAAALGTLLLAFLFWSRGRRGYKRGTEQDLPFVSGEKVENPRLAATHLYWGFAEALRPVLRRLGAWHSGVVNDYAAWFVVILAVIFLLIMV